MLPPAYYRTVFLCDLRPTEMPVRFAVVTAWNPMDRKCSDHANNLADAELKALLEQGGLGPFRVTGASPDLDHREPGWGFASSLEIALEIAGRFGQRAIWWVDADALHLVELVNPNPEPVGRFSERRLES